MNICQAEKQDKFQRLASARQSKGICGQPTEILCTMPVTVSQNGQKFFRLVPAYFCLSHAVNLAVNKLVSLMPPVPWTTSQLIHLIQSGCALHDLVFASAFPQTLRLTKDEMNLKTEQLLKNIKSGVLLLKGHPNFVKVPALVKERIELLEVFCGLEETENA